MMDINIIIMIMIINIYNRYNNVICIIVCISLKFNVKTNVKLLNYVECFHNSLGYLFVSQ